MLTPSQKEAFQRDGFLLYDQPVLTPAQTQELRDALGRVLDGKSAAKPESLSNISAGAGDGNIVIQVVNIWEAEPAFRRHLSNPTVVGVVAELMDTDTVRVWHDQIQVKPPKVGGPTIWHQDHPYWPVIQPADLVSAWVALEDATIVNGCMHMAKGSYHWGAYPGGTIGNDPDTHAPTPKADFVPDGTPLETVPVEVPAGHVVFHHCLTWHGAPPNRSDTNRPAIAVHYMPGHTRYEPQDRGHLVEHHITVAPGEVLIGDHFPTVYKHGHVLAV